MKSPAPLLAPADATTDRARLLRCALAAVRCARKWRDGEGWFRAQVPPEERGMWVMRHLCMAVKYREEARAASAPHAH